jgi:branched-chain amino acid transport system ATP-binding protein
MKIILETRELSKEFGGLCALRELDIEIHQGEVFGLIGPNGSGKTTFLNVITGFLKPSSGSVLYKGESIVGFEPYQIAKKGMVRIFQHTSLFSNLTIEANIAGGCYLNTSGSILGSFLHTKGYKEEQMELGRKVKEVLGFVGMQANPDTIVKKLSSGEQRSMEIAIALAAKPELLLLDEPAAGLNPEESKVLMSLIKSIQKEGITIGIIEHNMKVIMGTCNRIAVLDYGVKIAEGTPEEVAKNEKVISVYLGGRQKSA